MKIRRLVLACLVLFMPLFTLSAGAETPVQKMFVIGVELHEYQPYYGFDPENPDNYIGYAREFLDAFAQAKGYHFEYKLLPVKRLFSEFFANNLDFKFPDNPAWSSEERPGKTIHYSDTVCNFIDGLMVSSANQNIALEKLQEIGTVRGFTAWAFYDLITAKKLRMSEAHSLQALLKQVQAGRIDGAYGNITVSRHAFKDAGIKEGELLFAEHLPHHKGSYLLSTMRHPHIIKELNEFLVEKKDMISELRKKYDIMTFSEETTEESENPETEESSSSKE